MKITIIGSGLLGLSTGYHLAQEGHQITIVERRKDSALETSFANGGLLTPSPVSYTHLTLPTICSV